MERVDPAAQRDTGGHGPAPLESGRGTAEDRPWRSTITGRVDVTHLMHRGRRRAVRTYLPPGYEQAAAEHPVLYMFDGQNLFDRATTAYGMEWGIDETVESFEAILNGEVDEIPEQAFLNVGGLEQVLAKAKKLEES